MGGDGEVLYMVNARHAFLLSSRKRDNLVWKLNERWEDWEFRVN
jgi:hypothetical protein